MPQKRARSHHVTVSNGGERPYGCTIDFRATECLASECGGEPLLDAPLPLCANHVRDVYEFAQEFVDQRLNELSAVRTRSNTIPDELPPRGSMPGWVYFIRLGDRVKIGYSTKPQERLRNLPHEAVLGLVPGSRRVEAALHQHFAHLRVVGEWFRPELDLLEFIRDSTRVSA